MNMGVLARAGGSILKLGGFTVLSFNATHAEALGATGRLALWFSALGQGAYDTPLWVTWGGAIT